jgi:hypothetical protein
LGSVAWARFTLDFFLWFAAFYFRHIHSLLLSCSNVGYLGTGSSTNTASASAWFRVVGVGFRVYRW